MAYNSNYSNKKYTQSYDPNEDYQALINESVKNGNLAEAGKYEQQRNEKIDALGLGYEKTNDYSQYYQKPEGYDPDTDYSALIADAAANKDYDAAAMYEQQRNDKIDGENMDYAKTSKYTPYADAKKESDSLYQQYMNRDKFSYNVADDPLYQQYKDMYMSQGKLAMQDTMGQAAALTGGYGNSYAQTVGQQMYNQYLGKMNDIVPELYNAAYNRYQNDENELLKQYQMAQSRTDAERDRLDASQDKAFNFAMNLLQNGMNPGSEALINAGISTDVAKQIMYSSNKDDAYKNAITLLNAGIMPDDDMLVAAGISPSLARSFYKIATGKDYVVPGAAESGTAGNTPLTPGNTPPPPPPGNTPLMDLAMQYAAAHPGGQVDSRSVSTWLNNQGLTYEERNKVMDYLADEGFGYRYKKP